MSYTYQQIIDLAVQQATRGMVAVPSDVETTAESLLPVALDNVQKRLAADPARRTLLKKTKSLTLADGTVTLPTDVLTQFMDEAELYDPADLTKSYAYVPEWSDFRGQTLDTRLCHFALQNASTLAQVEAGSQYAAGSGFSGEMSLDVPCLIAQPGADTTALDVRDEVGPDVIRELAELLRGEFAGEGE